MQNLVNGSTFTFNNVTYTAPANQEYRIALFVEGDPRLAGELGRPSMTGGDLNRDGDTADIFAVLWDTNANRV
jgi:hypothetical protein